MLKRSRLELMLISGFLITLIVMAIFSGIWAHFLRSSDSNWASVAHTREVIQQLGKFKISLLDLESTERGYLIAGRDNLLAQHHQAYAAITANRAGLAQMVSDNPLQRERAESLAPLLQTRLATSDRLIKLRDDYGLGATQPVIVAGSDQEQSEKLSVIIDSMLQEEQRLLELRRSLLRESFSSISWLAVASGILILFLLSGLAIAIRGDLRRRALLVSHLDQIAHHDMLTGLANRRHFISAATAILSLGERNETMAAILMLDLDGFKSVNDKLGHDAGDALLQEVGVRLKAIARDSDLVARLGGDEFVLMLPSLPSHEGARVVAQKVIDVLGAPYLLEAGDPNPPVGASVGIAVFPDHGGNVEDLMRNADMALYAAKRAGKRQFVVYENGKF